MLSNHPHPLSFRFDPYRKLKHSYRYPHVRDRSHERGAAFWFRAAAGAAGTISIGTTVHISSGELDNVQWTS